MKPLGNTMRTEDRNNVLSPPNGDANLTALHALERNLAGVIRGKSESVRLVLTALVADGHVLLEDVPGTGKTTLAKSLARSLGGEFRRVQFTPDVMPADVTGSSFYHPNDGSFEFRPGPAFCNVLLADEINRASPRTQSALLEVMGEAQVSVEGARRALPRPFFVIATQNPNDFHGTYPLPEAQLDRFLMCVTLGYPSVQSEMEMIESRATFDPFESLQKVASTADVLQWQVRAREVHCDRAVTQYIVHLAEASRADARLRLALSPRASLALHRAAQARAWLLNRDFVTPDDVRALAAPVLAHRIQLDTKAKFSGDTGETIIAELLGRVAVPK